MATIKKIGDSYADNNASYTPINKTIKKLDEVIDVVNELENPTRSDVTQITSAATAVTTEGSYGIITTVSLTAAGDAGIGFTVNNSLITTSSIIILTIAEYQGNGTPVPGVQVRFAGSANIEILNVHPSAALNNVVKIGYQILN